MRTCLAVSSHLADRHVDEERIRNSEWLFVEGYVLANPNTGQGAVREAVRLAKKHGVARQTPRVSITIRRTAIARRSLGRSELKRFADREDGRPETELNFKFYRQATNKIVGLSGQTAAFLREFF